MGRKITNELMNEIIYLYESGKSGKFQNIKKFNKYFMIKFTQWLEAYMDNIGWDKVLTKQLVDAGLDWEKARFVVGIIAEQRQIADHQGYTRGFNDGYKEAEIKLKK